ncbi:MAG: nicotinic acid mononucleotide adenylyltransferase, partial [Gammaproteobacteria bacterium]|nr:nicotinic acid mononucleotide adenylyltransferase [Gammaproteobacteria bacterium]
FDYAHIVVVTRPGFKSEELLDCYIDRQVDDRHSLKSCPSGKIYFQQVTQLDISASLIRKTIAEGKNSSFLLPESVIEYIQANGLYQA